MALSVPLLFSIALLPATRARAAGDVDAACARSRRALLGGDAVAAERDLAELPVEHRCQACAIALRVSALIRLDRWEDALELARGCRELRPRDTAVAAALGEALFRAGLLGQAERLVAEIGSRSDLDGQALSLIGLLHAARGRAEAAEEAMRRAVAAAPQDRRVLYRATETATDRGEAIERLERYLELSAGDDPDRIQAAQGTLRTLRALEDRQVWMPDERPERAELRLRLLKRDSGRIDGAVVTARAGEARKPLRLLLDTGSSGLFLTRRAATKRGFETLAGEIAFGGGGDKRHVSARGLFSRVEVGPLCFRNALATTVESEFDPPGRYQGVLGVTIFAGYRVTLDLRRGRMLLDRADAAVDGAPFWIVAGQLLVEAGPLTGPAGSFLLDTGASSSVLDTAYAQSIPGLVLGEEIPLRGYGGMMQGARSANGVTLTFQGLDTGGATLRVADLSLRSRLGGVRIAGYLGMDLLRGATVAIETTTQRVKVLRAE